MAEDPYSAFADPVGKDPYASFADPAEGASTPMPDSSNDLGIGSTRPMMQVTPEQRLVEKLGFSYPNIQKAEGFNPGEVQNEYERSQSLQTNVPVLKQVGEVARGATAPARGLEQFYQYLKNKTGISSDSQYLLARAKLAAEQAAYDESGHAKLPLIGNPMEMLGGVGSMPNPNIGPLSSTIRASLPTLGKTALVGGSTAALQPVENSPDADFIGQKSAQIATGLAAAPIAQIGMEKLVSPLASKLLGKRSKNLDVRTLQKDLTRAGEDQGDIVQSELQKQYEFDRAEAAKPFQALRTKQGSVPVSQYEASLDEIADDLATSGARKDTKALGLIRDYKEGLANSKTDDWNWALNISKKLNEDISDAYNGPEPNRELGRQLEKAKRALEKDLDSHGVQFGDDYKKAKAGWAEKVAPWENPQEGGRILYKARNSPVPDEVISSIAKSKPDRAAIYFNRLPSKGQDAVKSFVIDDIMKEASGDPLKFTEAFKNRKDVIDVFFHGDDKIRIDGLDKLMKAARRTGSVAAASTGAAVANVWGPLSAAGGAWAGNRWLSAPFSRGFAKAFQTAPMQRLLLKAGNLPPNSPELQALLNQLPKMVGVDAGNNPNDKLKKLLGANDDSQGE